MKTILSLLFLIHFISYTQENMNENIITVYPNPAYTEGFYVSSTEDCLIKIFNQNGIYIGTWEKKANNDFKIDFLPIGCYELIFQNLSNVQRKKVFVI